MRFIIARVSHETNTFSPVPTELEAFEPRWHSDARRIAEESPTAMGAFLKCASRLGAEVVTPVYAAANPSGRVTDRTFDCLASAITDSAHCGADAILLDLHGAMVTESFDDGDGELLARIRAVAPATPIAVAADLHGNVTDEMVALADVLVSYKTYPHVDMLETGEHAFRLLDFIRHAGRKPATAWLRPPQLAHTLRMNTTTPGAMQDAIAAARAAEERRDALAASIFGGFPLADIPDPGMSVVVHAETLAKANATVAELATLLWRRRAEFVYHQELLEQSLAAAQKAAEAPGTGPVLLLDHCDNCMSGGTCDTTNVLEAALGAGLDGIVAGPIADPVAVSSLARAGVGTKISLGIGNRRDLTAFGLAAVPFFVSGTVRALGKGSYVVSGPTYTGMHFSMGEAAVLDIGKATILLSEQPHEPWDLGVFSCLGIDPTAARYLILKSRMYCRPVFEPLSRAVIECAGRGLTSSDYTLFPFTHLKRPIYPLDTDLEWRPPQML